MELADLHRRGVCAAGVAAGRVAGGEAAGRVAGGEAADAAPLSAGLPQAVMTALPISRSIVAPMMAASPAPDRNGCRFLMSMSPPQSRPQLELSSQTDLRRRTILRVAPFLRDARRAGLRETRVQERRQSAGDAARYGCRESAISRSSRALAPPTIVSKTPSLTAQR